MADVFILGAGFSMCVGSRMPGTNELGRRVIDQQMSIHRARPREHSSICDGLSCDAPVLPAQWADLDFEQLPSKLAEPQPYLYAPENMQRRALFEQLSGLIELQINAAVHQSISGQTVPGWLAKLVTYCTPIDQPSSPSITTP